MHFFLFVYDLVKNGHIFYVRSFFHEFPRLLQFTLDPYLIMLSVKQGRTKNHF